jgi:hypothetical protein
MLRRRHQRQSGQALVMALVLIAFFGLVTTSILQFTGTVELQQANTVTDTSWDSASEGGALFAAADAVNGGSGSPFSLGSCVAGSQSTMTVGGQSVSYATAGCNPGASAGVLAQQCAVCVIGTQTAATIGGTLAAQGPIAFNAIPKVTSSGSVTSVTRLQSGATNPGFITCRSTGPGCSGGGYSPAPHTLSTVVAAPFSAAALPPVPPPGAGPCGNVDSSWNPVDPIPPGVYCSITLSQPAVYTLSGGVYTILDNLQVSKHADLSGSGVLLYFTCAAGQQGDYVATCASGNDDGGAFDFSGNGTVSLSPYTPPGGANPDAVVMYFDPLENGPAVALSTSCRDSAVLCVNGNGNASVALAGTVYAASGQMDVLNGRLDIVAGDASPSPTGDVVVANLTIASGAAVGVDGLVPSGGYCWVYDDTATVTQGPATIGQAHVVVQVNCPNGAGGTASGIVDVNYGP